MRSNGLKLQQGRFGLAIRQLSECRLALLGEVAQPPSLEDFKSTLNKHVINSLV